MYKPCHAKEKFVQFLTEYLPLHTPLETLIRCQILKAHTFFPVLVHLFMGEMLFYKESGQHLHTSSLNVLGQLKPDYIWSFFRLWKQKFIQQILVTLLSWSPYLSVLTLVLQNLGMSCLCKQCRSRSFGF